VRDPQNLKLIQQLAAVNKAARDYTITYKDQDEEWINVSDDDDLQVAYMVATENFDKKLQLHVKFKTPQQLSEQLNKSRVLANHEPVISEQVAAESSKAKTKSEKKSKDKTVKKEAKSAAKKAVKKALKKALKEDKSLLEEEKTARTAATVEAQTAPKSHDSDSEDVSSADEEQEPKQKCMAKKTGLPPRKALKCLIMKELKASAPFIFESLIKCKELG
jgi:PB1 domain